MNMKGQGNLPQCYFAQQLCAKRQKGLIGLPTHLAKHAFDEKGGRPKSSIMLSLAMGTPIFFTAITKMVKHVKNKLTTVL